METKAQTGTTSKAELMRMPEMETYLELVNEIHLATASGDDMAKEGLQGMVEEKERIEKALGLTPEQMSAAFDIATQGSPYLAS